MRALKGGEGCAGPNGAGKSTLLRLAMGHEKPISGCCDLGEHHIVPNYFQQNQARPAACPSRGACQCCAAVAARAETVSPQPVIGPACRRGWPCGRVQAQALEPQLSVLETLERAAPDATLNDIKALLGRMMFSGKAMHKKVRAASRR